MFPTTPANTNGHHSPADTPTPLADIVRQETQDGRLIVRFLVSAMEGHVPDSKPNHRLDAARLLIRLGHDDAGAFVAAHNTRPSHRSARRNGARPELDRQLADIVRQETSNGYDAVRFLVDVMQGSLPEFKPHHRLSAARELLHRMSAIEVEPGPVDDDPGTLQPSDHDDGQPEPDDPGTLQPSDRDGDRRDPPPGNTVNYDTYDDDDYRRDNFGYQAKLNIFGSHEAVVAAGMAVFNYRRMRAGQADRDAIQSGQLRPPDPGDEPYGFRAITFIFGGDREAATVAYKGADEYRRRRELAPRARLQSDDHSPGGGPDDGDRPNDSPDPPPPEPPREVSPSPNEPSPTELRLMEKGIDPFRRDPYYYTYVHPL